MLGEAVRSIGANVSTTVAATMTVLIGMFLLGLFIAFATYAHSWSDHVKDELVVKVFFDRTAVPKNVEAVRIKLESDPRVDKERLEFISAAEGLERMRKERPDFFGSSGLPYNPLGAAYTVRPVEAEDTEAIADSLNPYPAGVHNVTFGEDKAKRILKVANVINTIFFLAGLILLAASTILIANTIRLSIFSRRREIEVMKLVGATNWFVRGPVHARRADLRPRRGRPRRVPTLPEQGDRAAGDHPEARQWAGRPGALLLGERADPARARAPARRRRIGTDAAPLPADLGLFV